MNSKGVHRTRLYQRTPTQADYVIIIQQSRTTHLPKQKSPKGFQIVIW